MGTMSCLSLSAGSQEPCCPAGRWEITMEIFAVNLGLLSPGLQLYPAPCCFQPSWNGAGPSRSP